MRGSRQPIRPPRPPPPSGCRTCSGRTRSRAGSRWSESDADDSCRRRGCTPKAPVEDDRRRTIAASVARRRAAQSRKDATTGGRTPPSSRGRGGIGAGRRAAGRAPGPPRSCAVELAKRCWTSWTKTTGALDPRYCDNHAAPELADRLGLPASTVRSRLSRATTRVRQRLDERWDGDRRGWAPAILAAPIPGTSSAAVGTSGATVMSAKLVAMIVACVLATTAGVWFLDPRTTLAAGRRASTATTTRKMPRAGVRIGSKMRSRCTLRRCAAR